MSDESNIAWALLAFGLLAAGGGYAAGRKVHREADPLVLQFRNAANKVMGDAAAFFRISKLRENEIAPKRGRFSSHDELPLTAADKAYFTVGTKEAREKLATLRQNEIMLTKRQRERLDRLWEQDIAFVAPIVARQSGITKIERPRFPGKHHPDKLLPDQIHVGAQGAIEHKPRADSVKERWKALRKELQEKHGGDLDKWTAEIKAHPLTAELKQKENSYWLQQVANVKQLA